MSGAWDVMGSVFFWAVVVSAVGFIAFNLFRAAQEGALKRSHLAEIVSAFGFLVWLVPAELPNAPRWAFHASGVAGLGLILFGLYLTPRGDGRVSGS